MCLTHSFTISVHEYTTLFYFLATFFGAGKDLHFVCALHSMGLMGNYEYEKLKTTPCTKTSLESYERDSII